MPHSLEANLSQTAFPESGGETQCRIEIKADPNQSERLPLHIVFCIDQSGSMSGRPIRLAKKGVTNAMQKLDDRDKFSVVAFDNSPEVIVRPTTGGQTAGVNLDSLSAGGGTHIIKGLEKSREIVERMGGGGTLSSASLPSNQNVVKWIALVSDGRPSNLSSSLSTLVSGFTRNVTGSKVEKHGAVAEALNDDGITVNTAGVGSKYDENIIEAISSRSGGVWEHHTSASGIEDFFKGKIDEGHNVVAPNPTLIFKPKNGVDVMSVKRTVPQIAEVQYRREDASYIITDFPDIRRDIAPEYIFDLHIPAHEVDPKVTFAEITLEIGEEELAATVNGEFTIDGELARDMDEGEKEIARESDTADTYLGRKDKMDKQTKEEEANAIARKRK